MAQQQIGLTRLAQRTSAAASNANFTELYARHVHIPLNATTANITFVVPAGYFIEDIGFQNITANAVTGGVKIGTTSGGTDVVAAQAVGANGLDTVAAANILKRVFSASADTTLYLQTVTAWNSASVNFKVNLRKMF